MRRIALSVMVMFTVGCGGSIHAVYKAEVDQRIADMQPSTASYAVSESIEPPPLAVGQWIELKVVDEKKRPGVMTYKIVGQQGDAFWVETATTTYRGKQESRMLINFGDRKNPETFDVQAFSLRNNGKITDYPPNMLGVLRSVWKPLLSNLVVQWNDAPREDARVIAGEFAGCYKRRVQAQVAWVHQTTEAWGHPAVPINGLVRSQGLERPTSIELVAFGLEGATSTFNEPHQQL